MKDNKSEIRDYFRVIRKRRWLVILPTLFCILVVGAVSFILPKKWEVDCIIRPSEFFIQTTAGVYQEFSVSNPRQIAELINQGAYDTRLSAYLNIPPADFPRLTAENLRNTNLVRVSLRVSRIERGKAILLRLFELLKSDLDRNIKVEMKSLETLIANNENEIVRQDLNIKDKENSITVKRNEIQLKNMEIKAKEVGKEGIEQEIKSTGNLLKISEERIKNILEEMGEVRTRVQQIEEQKNKVLAEGKDNTLSLLLYSNETQENLRYYNTLNGELSNERTNQENLKLSVQKKQDELRYMDIQIEMMRTGIKTLTAQIDEIENDIERTRNEIRRIQNDTLLLKEKQVRYDLSQLIKEPTPSTSPVSPKRLLNVLLAAILGLSLFTLLAFALEYTGGHSAAPGEE